MEMADRVTGHPVADQEFRPVPDHADIGWIGQDWIAEGRGKSQCAKYDQRRLAPFRSNPGQHRSPISRTQWCESAKDRTRQSRWKRKSGFSLADRRACRRQLPAPSAPAKTEKSAHSSADRTARTRWHRRSDSRPWSESPPAKSVTWWHA